MNLMLFCLFAWTVYGLWLRRFGSREQLTIAFAATTMTALYLFAGRFM